jgi:hypothetical protein
LGTPEDESRMQGGSRTAPTMTSTLKPAATKNRYNCFT